MATQTYFCILTAVGEAKDANAKALGTALKFTNMAVGDGNGVLPTPDRARTALVHEVRRAPINTLKPDPLNPGQVIAEQIIPEDVGGWWIRELGLYDADGDLVAIGNCPETYKPQLSQGSGRVQVVRMVLIMSSAATVQLKIDPSVVLATRKYVDDQDAATTTAITTTMQSGLALKADLAGAAFTGPVSATTVGIGTQAPTGKLDIAGNTVNSIQAVLTRGSSDINFRTIARNGTSNAVNTVQASFGMEYLGQAAPGQGMAAGFNFMRGAGGLDSSILFVTYNREQARLSAQGNLHLGTGSNTINGARLSVAGSIPSIGGIAALRNDSTTGASSLVAQDDTQTKYCEIGIANSACTLGGADYGLPGEGFVRASYSSLGLNISTAALAGYVRFSILGTEKMRLTATGFGIGTNAPAYPLDVKHVTGGHLATGRTSNAGASSEPGNWYITAPNASGNSRIWGAIRTVVGNATDGAEAASMTFNAQKAGVLTEAMRIDSSGNLLVGVSTGSSHSITKSGLPANASNTILNVQGGMLMVEYTNGGAYSTTGATLKVGKDAVTTRSINTGGTVNASGADYAEYMQKADDCGVIAKGQIVGIDVDGKLTDNWARAVSFLIKSTDPSYVGGDVWGSEDAVGARPVEPVFRAQEYTGPDHPGNAPVAPAAPVEPAAPAEMAPFVEPAIPAAPENPTEAEQAAYNVLLLQYEVAASELAASYQAEKEARADQYQADLAQHAAALALYQEKLAKYQEEKAAYDIALATYEHEQAEHAAKVESDLIHYNTITMPAYQAELAQFESRFEAARQRVDRMAYCGQVPVNVLGAKPGQYVVPVQDGEGIAGQLVDNAAITFDQYRRAVGIVQNILPDGRANVRVKPV